MECPESNAQAKAVIFLLLSVGVFVATYFYAEKISKISDEKESRLL